MVDQNDNTSTTPWVKLKSKGGTSLCRERLISSTKWWGCWDGIKAKHNQPCASLNRLKLSTSTYRAMVPERAPQPSYRRQRLFLSPLDDSSFEEHEGSRFEVAEARRKRRVVRTRVWPNLLEKRGVDSRFGEPRLSTIRTPAGRI